MSKFNDHYFFIRPDESNERLPFLTPDVNTCERRYTEHPVSPGSAPLIFSNGWKAEFAARGIKEDVADVLFEGLGFIVRDHIRDRLLSLDLCEVHLHPAVYIDDSGNWHEDYWFVAIMNRFDCWDRDTSTFDDEPLEIGGQKLFSMYTYALDDKVVDAKPLPERLLFLMGGTQDGMITCHKSVASVFRGHGAVLQPITDY